MPSDETLRQIFKSTIEAAIPRSENLSLYSYRKFMVNAFHANELHAKARAGWVEFERQATADASGSTTAGAWVSSVDISSHYIGLESSGDERIALILGGKHPDAPFENHVINWLKHNCPVDVIETLVNELFPKNVRVWLCDKPGLTKAMVFGLLVAKAKKGASSNIVLKPVLFQKPRY